MATQCCGRWPIPAPDGLLALEHPHVEREEPLVWDESDAALTHTVTHEWNHGLGEIVTALLDQGLRLTAPVEHGSLTWDAMPGQMERLENGEFRLADRPWRLPHSYTLQAVAE